MNYEKINAAARELQELVAKAIKEEMPERSQYVTRMFYVGNLQVFNDGSIIMPASKAPEELVKAVSHLELAVLVEEKRQAEMNLETAKANYDECVKRLNNMQ